MKFKKVVHCIVAMDSKRGIGKDNALPWMLKKEMKHFREITVGCSGECNAVIMGRNTYESIPKKFRPLKNRFNIVLSRNLKESDVEEGIKVVPNLTAAMELLSREPYLWKIEDIFIIGGEGVCREAVNSDYCEKIYLTKIQGDFSCDVFFPEFDGNIYKEISLESVPQGVQEENGIKYTFHVYARK